MCLFIISLYLKTRKNENNVLLYFSEFSIVFAIWMIGEARMLQFFIGNVAIISLLPFVAILIFPLPFVLFVEEACELHHPLEKKFLTGIYWAFTLNLIVSLSIHLLNIYALPESLWMTHILCGVGMTGVVVCCLYEAIKFKNEDARKLLRAEGIFFLFAAIEMIKYYLGTSINLAVTQYLRIGYIIFAIMIGADSIAKIQRMSDERKEREYYQKLAYIDLLTHGRNRTAYMEEMDTLFQKGSPEGIGLILFDLNNLKKINDELGHLTGDEAIQKAYQCIEDVFGKIGKCYRVGGDEFACVIMNAERDILENLEISFRTVIKNAGDGLKYDFQVAMGFAIYSQEIYGDKAYEGLYSQADQNMYQDKANLKKMRQVL